MDRRVWNKLYVAIRDSNVDALRKVLLKCDIEAVSNKVFSHSNTCALELALSKVHNPTPVQGLEHERALNVVKELLVQGVSLHSKAFKFGPLNALSRQNFPTYRSVSLLLRFGANDEKCVHKFSYWAKQASGRRWHAHQMYPAIWRHFRCEQAAIVILGLRRRIPQLLSRDTICFLAHIVMSTRYCQEWQPPAPPAPPE